MKTTKVICDLCKREINSVKEREFCLEIKQKQLIQNLPFCKTIQYDLCSDCVKELKDLMQKK